MKLGIVCTHPVQYYAPWFRHLAARREIEVLYAHRVDAAGQAAAGFGVPFDWDVPLLDGYPYRWLANVAARPGIETFGGLDSPEIGRVLREGKFDAALILGWNRKVLLQAFWAAKRLGLTVLGRGDSQLRTPRSPWVSLVKYLPYRAFLPRFDAHLYVGVRNREYLRRYGVPERKLFFGPHFVDSSYFRERAATARSDGSAARMRADLGIGAGALVFLFVGKLIPKKRPLDVVRGFERRDGTIEDAHLVLVGDGALRVAVEEYVGSRPPLSTRVHLVGFKNQSELPAAYAMSDVLVLPSDGGETWGLVVNEAMACGVPAVVSEECGCAPDLVEGGATGATFPLGDVDALARNMAAVAERLRRDRDGVLAALGAKVARYSIETATAGLDQAIESV